MAGKSWLSVRFTLVIASLSIALLMAGSAEAYRICTFRGTVVEHGWRTMTVNAGGQCATLNVGWRTKFVPNRRPCIGERVAVDFMLEDGYMKATKVLSLTPTPVGETKCYPPPPPRGTVCRDVPEAREPTCTAPPPVCSRTPPPHATPKWAPKKKPGEAAPPKPKPERKPVAVTPPPEEPTPPPQVPKKEPVPVEEEKLKTLEGRVIASQPRDISVQVTGNGGTEQVKIRVGLSTKFDPFRRPSVGEMVRVHYQEENGGKFAQKVEILE